MKGYYTSVPASNLRPAGEPPSPAVVYSGMPGMLFFAFFATIFVLRLTRPPGGSLTSGIVLMMFGVWMVWSTVTHNHYGFHVYGPPEVGVLAFGLWLVVKGALRASSY